jgi:hypothetical protein
MPRFFAVDENLFGDLFEILLSLIIFIFTIVRETEQFLGQKWRNFGQNLNF